MGFKKYGQTYKFRNNLKKKHKRRSKKPVKLKYEEPDELKRAPHSFVIHRGTVGKQILELEKDFRKVMDPFTASVLQVSKKNSLKDFVSISGPLKVSHMIIFTNSSIGPYMRIARFPQGPTLMFRIHNYSLCKDVLSTIKKQLVHKKLYTNAPLVVLNNFTEEGSNIKLMATVFQNMFPTINVTKVKLSDIRRCVMLNYNTSTKMIDFRHYAIKAFPVGLSKGVKKLVQSKIPDLSKYEDISEYLTKPMMQSESEAEDDPNSYVQVPQKLASRGNMVSKQSAIRLIELGPRLTLQLLKIEEGLLSGEVLYHELIKKTEEEKKIIRKRILQKRKLKEQRRKQQEENIKKKEIQKEEHKMKSLEGMKRKIESTENEYANEEVDDDVAYFKEEVGQEPDKDVITNKTSSESGGNKQFIPRWKKKKMENEKDGNIKKKKRVTFKVQGNNHDSWKRQTKSVSYKTTMKGKNTKHKPMSKKRRKK